MTYFDYRDILRAELRGRKNLSPKYSLRDFAKDLGLLPSHLSYVLRKMRGLSQDSGQKVANAIGLKGVVRRQFLFLIAARSARSKGKRNLAGQALQRWFGGDQGKMLLGTPTWKEQVQIFITRKPLLQHQRMLQRISACGL